MIMPGTWEGVVDACTGRGITSGGRADGGPGPHSGIMGGPTPPSAESSHRPRQPFNLPDTMAICLCRPRATLSSPVSEFRSLLLVSLSL